MVPLEKIATQTTSRFGRARKTAPHRTRLSPVSVPVPTPATVTVVGRLDNSTGRSVRGSIDHQLTTPLLRLMGSARHGNLTHSYHLIGLARTTYIDGSAVADSCEHKHVGGGRVVDGCRHELKVRVKGEVHPAAVTAY